MNAGNDRFDDGGSDDGTPIERLLREALTARAEQVGVHDLRPAEPPSRKVRRLRAVYATVLPLGLAAALAIGYLGFNGHNVADHVNPGPAASVGTSHSPEPKASPSTDPSPSASAPASQPAGEPPAGSLSSGAASTSPGAGGSPSSAPVTLGATQSFRGVTFRLPTGWTTSNMGPLSPQECLVVPNGPTGPPTGCPLALTVYSTAGEVSQATYPTAGELTSSDGWAHQPECDAPNNPHLVDPNGNSDTQTLTSFDHSQVTVAGQPATRSTWGLKCSSGEAFTTRMWGLTGQQVFLRVTGLSPQYEAGLQAVLGSLDASGVLQPQQTNPVGFTLYGFGPNQSLHANGAKTPFSVTVGNNGSQPLVDVIPQVNVGQQNGTLEEQLDDGSWISVGMSSATVGPVQNVPGFPLDPGKSKTVNYRISLAPSATPVTQLTLTEMAWLKFTPEGSLSMLGTGTVNLPVAAN
ncbi:hypothetical protein [Kitasatospora viridis]|uniref:DUF4232 domain-containing protein n=1 Tax=Kitasatospora viridis TaxID=281105 RepID=A0A561UHZ1_9ACTN|nr:hypothetical protein [Kitasatospora viridis]TWF98972.1 hypothetical protein FHX73_112802 [Kitasatospora viridis]